MTTETSNAREWVLVPRGLLEAAVCPMKESGCDGTQYPVQPYGEGEQCQWCCERRASLTAPPPAAARGDVPYDRDLIARMLDVCGHPKFTLEAYMEQARLLREADNAAVANVGTVAARGDVRIIARDIHYAIMDDGLAPLSNADNHKVREAILRVLQAALDAEGVQAGDVASWQRSIEVLPGHWGEWAEYTDIYEEGRPEKVGRFNCRYRPLYTASALSHQPEARGVVDELRRTVAAIGIVGEYLGKDTILRESVLDIIDRRIAALTGERNG